MANKEDDLEFVTIPKDTCFLSGVDIFDLTKDDIWLSYYGFINVQDNNINKAIHFSERYGEDCGIAFFKNKYDLKLFALDSSFKHFFLNMKYFADKIIKFFASILL